MQTQTLHSPQKPSHNFAHFASNPFPPFTHGVCSEAKRMKPSPGLERLPMLGPYPTDPRPLLSDLDHMDWPTIDTRLDPLPPMHFLNPNVYLSPMQNMQSPSSGTTPTDSFGLQRHTLPPLAAARAPDPPSYAPCLDSYTRSPMAAWLGDEDSQGAWASHASTLGLGTLPSLEGSGGSWPGSLQPLNEAMGAVGATPHVKCDVKPKSGSKPKPKAPVSATMEGEKDGHGHVQPPVGFLCSIFLVSWGDGI